MTKLSRNHNVISNDYYFSNIYYHIDHEDFIGKKLDHDIVNEIKERFINKFIEEISQFRIEPIILSNSLKDGLIENISFNIRSRLDEYDEPEGITLGIIITTEESDTEYTLRLNDETKKLVEYVELEKQKRYQQYLELKKEFEND